VEVLQQIGWVSAAAGAPLMSVAVIIRILTDYKLDRHLVDLGKDPLPRRPLIVVSLPFRRTE
jgi:hypothetical protein